MTRRRVISAEMLVDEEFNSLSLEAQILFLRMLCVSDDYGIVPANEARLCAVLNLSQTIRDNITSFVDEIVDKQLGFKLEADGKRYFVFKPQSFKFWQAQLLSRRQKSEYLRMSGEEVLNLFSQQLQIHLEDFGRLPKTSDLRVESRKQKAESKEKKVASREQKAESSDAVDPSVSCLSPSQYCSKCKLNHSSEFCPKTEEKEPGAFDGLGPTQHCRKHDIEHTDAFCPKCLEECKP